MNYAEDSVRLLAVQYRQCVVSSYFTEKVWHGAPKSQTIICKTWHFLFFLSFSFQWEMFFLEQEGFFVWTYASKTTVLWCEIELPTLLEEASSGQLHFQPQKVFACSENQLKLLITMENTVWKSCNFMFSNLCKEFFFHDSFKYHLKVQCVFFCLDLVLIYW